jgi:hypothetical protein
MVGWTEFEFQGHRGLGQILPQLLFAVLFSLAATLSSLHSLSDKIALSVALQNYFLFLKIYTILTLGKLFFVESNVSLFPKYNKCL